MRKENSHNKKIKEVSAFNRAIAFQHIIDGSKSVQELAKAMFISEILAWDHLVWFEKNEFATVTKAKRIRVVKVYAAANIDKYKWPKAYKNSKNPQRDYFDKVVYPDLHKELRDAIFEGRISADVVKVYNRADTERWALNYKSDYHGGFQSTMNGEYFV
jgi:hypothetical protein